MWSRSEENHHHHLFVVHVAGGKCYHPKFIQDNKHKNNNNNNNNNNKEKSSSFFNQMNEFGSGNKFEEKIVRAQKGRPQHLIRREELARSSIFSQEIVEEEDSAFKKKVDEGDRTYRHKQHISHSSIDFPCVTKRNLFLPEDEEEEAEDKSARQKEKNSNPNETTKSSSNSNSNRREFQINDVSNHVHISQERHNYCSPDNNKYMTTTSRFSTISHRKHTSRKSNCLVSILFNILLTILVIFINQDFQANINLHHHHLRSPSSFLTSNSKISDIINNNTGKLGLFAYVQCANTSPSQPLDAPAPAPAPATETAGVQRQQSSLSSPQANAPKIKQPTAVNSYEQQMKNVAIRSGFSSSPKNGATKSTTQYNKTSAVASNSMINSTNSTKKEHRNKSKLLSINNNNDNNAIRRTATSLPAPGIRSDDHRSDVSAVAAESSRVAIKRVAQDFMSSSGDGDIVDGQEELQISITPRVSQIRVPVDSNTMLKCLISSTSTAASVSASVSSSSGGGSGNKLSQKFNIHWSRFMYDENVYEHLDTSPIVRSLQPIDSNNNRTSFASNNNQQRSLVGKSGKSSTTTTINQQQQHQQDAAVVADQQVLLMGGSEMPQFNRQQQLRDFLDRSRQETNIISDLLIEATLSISPVKASDNATYYCTASDGRSSSSSSLSSSSMEQNQARIDLIALSRPIVQLERVYPARDSKSALIYWLILSDGNTPIKKTILMVRNDTNGAQFNSRPLPPGMIQENLATMASSSGYPTSGSGSGDMMDNNGEQQQQQQQPTTTTTTTNSQYSSSMVIDSNHNQWQRIELPDDGLMDLSFESVQHPNLMSPYDHPSQVASADVDVTSPLGSGSSSSSGGGGGTNSSNSNHYQQQSLPAAPNNDDDYYATTTSRIRWSLATKRRQQRSYNLTSLLPGVTYNFRLAAINDMGQSDWSYLTATMPNEIPAQISEMFLLSRRNDSLAIGWRRPAYDGAKTIRYEMQLFDLNRTLTLDANTNTTLASSHKTNFMYIFVNLQPGSDYHFHVRACSRAGCSAYSNPKLLATTLDGEPDEPLEVELQCEPESGNVSVSWLPPVNGRGQLLNYSVSFDSLASYRNQSGQWQVDEWRSTMETGDNQTLSLEAGHILLPNTNYSVRVCANNRSKYCGKLSQITSRSQCSTPPELPNQLPGGINLRKKTIPASANEDTNEDPKSKEYLQLELPYISSRNGTLSCIQIVLIRLPDTFAGSNLNEYLPERPDDVTLSRYMSPSAAVAAAAADSTITPVLAASQQGNKKTTTGLDKINQRKYLAYLAEEVDPSSGSSPSSDKNQHRKVSNNQQQQQQQEYLMISLGDGKHEQCQMRQSEPIARPEVFDGPLKARAYYTGFVKLILVRPNHSRDQQQKYFQTTSTKRNAATAAATSKTTASIGSQEGQVEILTKFSNYFEPVQMGDNVLELNRMLSTISDINGDGDSDADDRLRMSVPFSGDTLIGEKLKPLQELALEFGVNLKRNFYKYYDLTSNYVGDNLRLENLGEFIRKSSPLMQLFEVGILVIVISLLLLFIVYLITLPTKLARRRKRRIKCQLNKHQQDVAASAAAAAQAANQNHHHQHQLDNQPQYVNNQKSPVGHQEAQAIFDSVPMPMEQQHQHQQDIIDHHQLQHSIEYQPIINTNHNHQHPDDQVYPPAPVIATELQQQQHKFHGGVAAPIPTAPNRECPIHSSPANSNNSNSRKPAVVVAATAHEHRQATVHVCQPMLQQVYTGNNQTLQRSNGDQENHYHHQHHPQQQHQHQHHHHHHQEQQHEDFATIRQQQYERNCRTTRRQSQHHYQHQQQQQPYDLQSADIQSLSAKNCLTLSHQQQLQNSALALAKKINKSIPLRLFRSVFELRLQNGWLKEEYEQLPSTLIPVNYSSLKANALLNNQGTTIVKLRPQLVVSRNDTMSALISGNDQYDAGLITFGGGVGAGAGNVGTAGVIGNRSIICAKSPLDADSVWDFWRLVYEQEVSTIVMLTQNEDANTGELRCAQYWPTCDNEETTILSPCNEFVQKSSILPAKFKIRQETLEEETAQDGFMVRRLTLMVMATKPGENEQQDTTTSNGHTTTAAAIPDDDDLNDGISKKNKIDNDEVDDEQQSKTNKQNNDGDNDGDDDDDDDEKYIIIQRDILQLQFHCWNTSNLTNQLRLTTFIRRANERHLISLKQQQQQQQHSSVDGELISPQRNAANSPMLVHCFNGLGRSGVFAGLSFIIDELSMKLRFERQLQQLPLEQQQLQQQVQKLNLFQLVTKMRIQREMLISPYRFYELLYQMTANCIPQDAGQQIIAAQAHIHR